MTARPVRNDVESVLADHARRIDILNATPCGSGLLKLNLADMGMSGGTTRTTSYAHTIQFEDVAVDDGILVYAMAPSLPVALGTQGFPVSCTDSAGNTYSTIHSRDYQHSPALVNTGVYVVVFFCQSSVANLVAGVDTITVTWDNSVFDRSICAFLVRHDGGTNVPTVLASTASNDMAVYAATQVTLTSPYWVPARDNSMEFGFHISIGGGTLARVPGWTGFYQSAIQTSSRNFNGSKQNYGTLRHTHGADVFAQVAGLAPHEINLGKLYGGDPVAAFNGDANNWGAGAANKWKSIILVGLD